MKKTLVKIISVIVTVTMLVACLSVSASAGLMLNHSVTIVTVNETVIPGCSASTPQTEAFAGSTVSIGITLAPKTTVKSVTSDQVTVSGTGNSRGFTMLNTDVTVTVTFGYDGVPVFIPKELPHATYQLCDASSGTPETAAGIKEEYNVFVLSESSGYNIELTAEDGYEYDGNKTATVGFSTDQSEITFGQDIYIIPEPTPHVHSGTLEKGLAPTVDAAGYKDCYKCKCGEFFEDEKCESKIDNVETWRAKDGKGYLAPLPKKPEDTDTLKATDFDGKTLKESKKTYQKVDDKIYVYAEEIAFTGETSRDLIIKKSECNVTLKNFKGKNIYGDNAQEMVALKLENAVIDGDIDATVEKGAALYLYLEIYGKNTISGSVTSSGTITVYGDTDASVSFKKAVAGEYFYLDGIRIENANETYKAGEMTKSFTPKDESKPVKMTVKALANFPYPEDFEINGGKDFKHGEKVVIPVPVITDANGKAINKKFDLIYTYYRVLRGEETSWGIEYVQEKDPTKPPVDEGEYAVLITISDSDNEYYGSGYYPFFIDHNLTLVTGDGNHKDYYKCSGCDTLYKDAEGLKEITDLSKWVKADKSDKTETSSADTSDRFDYTLYVALLVVSALTFAAVTTLKSKKKEN